MPDATDHGDGAAEQRQLLARLRAVIEAKDTAVSILRGPGWRRTGSLRRRMELRIAELERLASHRT